MVGEDFNALDIVECADEVSGARESFIIVASAGHEYVTDPDWLLDFV